MYQKNRFFFCLILTFCLVFIAYLCVTKAKNMKVAKLVKVSLMVRVVVDENTTDFDVAEIALPELLRKLDDDIYESIEEIENDDECPFGTFNTD